VVVAQGVETVVSYLRGLGLVPAEPDRLPGGPALQLAARYRGYLVGERGLSPATARLCAHFEPGR
jgi:hypothetical protein